MSRLAKKGLFTLVNVQPDPSVPVLHTMLCTQMKTDTFEVLSIMFANKRTLFVRNTLKQMKVMILVAVLPKIIRICPLGKEKACRVSIELHLVAHIVVVF